jgi:hypothetical protein
MSILFDLLFNKSAQIASDPHEMIRALHKQCLQVRDMMGPVTARFRDGAASYRKTQADLAGEADPKVKAKGLRDLRTGVYNDAYKALGLSVDDDSIIGAGWVKELQDAHKPPIRDRQKADSTSHVVGTYFQLFTDLGFFNAAINLYDKIPEESSAKKDPDIMLGLANACNYRADRLSTPTNGAEVQYVSHPDPARALKIAKDLDAYYGGVNDPYVKQFLEPKIAGIKARAKILLTEQAAEKLTAGDVPAAQELLKVALDNPAQFASAKAGDAADAKAIIKAGLQEAHALYDNNFTTETGFHHYTGYNSMLTAAELGDLQKSRDTASKVFLATMRDNGIFASDPLTIFRTTMAMAVNPEVATVGMDGAAVNNTIEKGLSNLKNSIVEPWQKHAFIRDAKRLRDALRTGIEQNTIQGEMRQHAERTIETIEKTVAPALETLRDPRKEAPPAFIGDDDPRRELLAQYAYAPAANSIIPGAGSGKGVVLGGNLSKGYLIPDMQISAQGDYFSVLPLVEMPLEKVEEALGSKEPVFPEAIRHKSLKQLAAESTAFQNDGSIVDKNGYKFGAFYEAVRLLTREVFYTKQRNMENMASKGHSHEFERGLKSLYAICGLSKDDKQITPLNNRDGDDKTIFANAPTAVNASHLLAMRQGDCRMYKVMSGLFYRIAQAAAQNDIIGGMDAKDAGAVSAAMKKARDIRRVQLVNFDLDLWGDVEVGKGGWADRDAKTNYFVKKAGARGYLEPHSVNLLVERNPTGAIDNLGLACTFYNGEYLDETPEHKKVDGATYDLRVPITKDMVKRVDKGTGKKPEFEIELMNAAKGFDAGTGFKVVNSATGLPEKAGSLIATASKYSHCDQLIDFDEEKKPLFTSTGTRRLYGTTNAFLSAEMPPVNLESAWRSKVGDRVLVVANELDNLRAGRPPGDLPARAAGSSLADPNALAV